MTDEPRRVVELLAQILSRLEAIDKKLEQACAAVGENAPCRDALCCAERAGSLWGSENSCSLRAAMTTV